MILVCSLARLPEAVEKSGARHVVTLVRDEARVLRPNGIAPADHLWLQMDDIVEPIEGMLCPSVEHVQTLIEFVGRWDRAKPLVVHCFAGISRSTAAAFITACALAPHRDEAEIARRLRKLSSTAYPNPRLVALADAHLKRGGRMNEAIARIGRGSIAYEGEPFMLPVD